MCFMWISEQTAIISDHNTNIFAFYKVRKSPYVNSMSVLVLNPNFCPVNIKLFIESSPTPKVIEQEFVFLKTTELQSRSN